MRVLQGHGVGAFQDNPPEDPDAEFLDTRRTGGQDEVGPVRQAARAILSGEAERRAGICQGLLSVLVRSMGTSSALNMLREYANNVSFDARGFIEQVGGYSLDSVAMGHKLRLPSMLGVPFVSATSFIAASLIWHGTISPAFIIVNANAIRSLSCPTIWPRVSGI